MSELTDEQRRIVAQLAEPIPADAIERKQGKLDYVKGGWVTKRLNEILGPHGWSCAVLSTQVLSREEAGDGKHVVIAQAHVRLTAHALGDVVREDVAAGSGIGRSVQEIYHQALGEAVTDALKRCAARLGNAVGGMLYLSDDDAGRRDGAQAWASEAERDAHVAEVAAAYDSAATVDQGRDASRLARQLGVAGDPRVQAARESAAQRIRGAQRQGDE